MPRPCASPSRLHEDDDYTIDDEAHSVSLTKAGKLRCHDLVAEPSSTADCKDRGALYVEQALQAKLMLKKDIDYVVADGKIVLVDGATGRLCPDRNWSEGLHQILEVKENLKHSGELRTAARITRQRYFRMYDMLCGMTGTAMESRGEFWRTFGLRGRQGSASTSFEANRHAARFFADAASKWRAVVEEIGRVQADGTARADRLANHRKQRSARQAVWMPPGFPISFSTASKPPTKPTSSRARDIAAR